jgi:aminoglycoside phosphotransferase (APT) family kinase protein
MFPQKKQADVIPVRADERFDEVKVKEFLEGKLDGADQPMIVQQFGGGAANLTYLLTFGNDHQYVLRRPPLGPIAPSAHDMAREFKVLSVLYRVFPYAPRAYVFSDDEEIIGAPFVVMERRVGTVVRRTLPDYYADSPDAPRQMSEALVDRLAELHAVNYPELGLDDLGRPDGFIERQIEGWYRRWHKSKGDDNVNIDDVYQWLKHHLPKSMASTLIHNDFKLDNTMFATDDPSKMVAVFDWDMCTLGDPLSDVGALLTYWTQPDDPPFAQVTSAMPVGDYGFLTRKQLIQRYEEKSGRDLSDIRIYHALGTFRLAVIIQQIYIRYVRGQTKDERFAGFGQVVDALAQTAKQITLGEFD